MMKTEERIRKSVDFTAVMDIINLQKKKPFGATVVGLIKRVPVLEAENEKLRETLKLERQTKEFNATIPSPIWDNPELKRCIYRDVLLTKCRNKKPPENLITHDLRPEICLACQKLREKACTEWTEYERIHQLFNRVGAKKVSLVVGLHTQLEQTQAERDDYKRRYEEDLNNEKKNLHEKYQRQINTKDAKIKQLEKYASDRDQDLKLKNMRIETLELSLGDPERVENLESENQRLTSELETFRKVADHLKTESATSTHQEVTVWCPTKGLVKLSFCQERCSDLLNCPAYLKIKESREKIVADLV